MIREEIRRQKAIGASVKRSAFLFRKYRINICASSVDRIQYPLTPLPIPDLWNADFFNAKNLL